ncbi:ATP-binding protein [Actinomycetaceae bacterium MB13-C1-2]|nr:ATP-binding protein [Actinomycetaceae bacterium MB13-C1-2]
MRRRATRMILSAVIVVVLILGIPAAILGGRFVWESDQAKVDTRAVTVARSVDRRLSDDLYVTQSIVAQWADAQGGEPEARIVVTIPGKYYLVANSAPVGPSLSGKYRSLAGATVEVEVSAIPTIQKIVFLEVMLLTGVAVSLLLAWVLARNMSRRLSAPLIYLAAQAEQIGSGQVRAQVKPSGIEEIDLVQEELVRTGERMARRLAAERQRSADASHQLRTPLTALSMRLEEIQYISKEPEVQEEAEACLGQVERLTTVVNDLLDSARRAGSETEVVQLLEVFNNELEEWEGQFSAAGRSLVFQDEAAQLVLAEEGKLTQILAILIENSLRYGAGATVVRSRRSGSSRAVLIDVSDEGEGISPDVAEEVFEMGYSEHGSSGIGLALAKDLAQGMGARLELTKNSPPVFTLSLSAIPSNFDPNIVMPQAPLMSVGRRANRL